MYLCALIVSNFFSLINTGTFYGYVKDAAGNTGSCSISIVETTKTTTYTCKHAYDACSSGSKSGTRCYQYSSVKTMTYQSTTACKKSCKGFCDEPVTCYYCSSGYSLSSNLSNCYKVLSNLNACSSGTKTNGACYKYKQKKCASGWTKDATNNNYSCPSEYTKISNSYCYK